MTKKGKSMTKGEKTVYEAKIQQLHNATLQFSKNTMEIKKLFVTVIIAFFTIVSGLEKQVFEGRTQIMILLILTLLFWGLDAQSYYYQKKLRDQINELENLLMGKKYICHKRRGCKDLLQSSFNASMFIYYICILLLLIIRWRM